MAALPFADGTFDGVQSSHSAEHLDHGAWCGAVKEMRRVLDDGGMAVAVVPDFEGALGWVMDGKEEEPMYTTGAGIPIYAHDVIYGFQRMVGEHPHMRHLNGFTPKRLYRSFVDAGFKDVTVHRINGILELEVAGMAA